MSKNINDEKYEEYKKKQFSKYAIIILSLIVIVLETLALFQVIDMIWGIVFFAIIYLLKKFYIK